MIGIGGIGGAQKNTRTDKDAKDWVQAIENDNVDYVSKAFEEGRIGTNGKDLTEWRAAYLILSFRAEKCFEYLKNKIDFNVPINKEGESAFAMACAQNFKIRAVLARINETGGAYTRCVHRGFSFKNKIDLEWYLATPEWELSVVEEILSKAPKTENQATHEPYRKVLFQYFRDDLNSFKGALPSLLNLWQGPNPLSYLDYNNSSTPAIVDEVLKRYKIDALDANGLTPLQSDLSTRKISILLSRGAGLYAQGQEGMTPLENIALHHDDENNDLLKAVDPYIQPEKDAQKITQAVENLRNQGHCDAAKRLEKYAQVGGWHEPVISQQKITHVSVDGTLNKRITDVFNFASRERYTQLKDLTTEAETYLRENFDSEGANRNFWRTAAEHYVAHPQGAAEAPQLDEFLHSCTNQKRAVSPIALTGQRKRLGPGADPANN